MNFAEKLIGFGSLDKMGKKRKTLNDVSFFQVYLPVVVDCLICELPLKESPSVEVTRGLQTLITSSLTREDGLNEQFKNKTSLEVHIDCRRLYTRRPAPNKDIEEPHKKSALSTIRIN